VLQGSLDTFGLEDVVTFLAATAKTGRLHVNGDRGTGSLWFAQGDVVAAMAANVPLEADIGDVVFELLRYRRGDFAFSLGEAAAAGGPPHAVGPLLDHAQGALEEWRELTEVVPSPEHRVLLLAELVDEHVILDRDQWRTVLAIGPGSTVAELGEALREGEVPVLRRVCDLLAKALVEVLEPAGAPIVGGAGGVHHVEPAPVPGHDAYRWAESDRVDDASSNTATATPTQTPTAVSTPTGSVGGGEGEPIDHALLEQLGGLSPRAAQAVSEAAARGDADDSVLMSMLRDEL
jgi:hypothetical protein